MEIYWQRGRGKNRLIIGSDISVQAAGRNKLILEAVYGFDPRLAFF